MNLAGEPISIELSNDNAVDALSHSVEPIHKPDDLTSMFQKYQKSVVTVWSELGSGTGFIVDRAGLILTNQHVVGPSDLISIQFDEKRKVAAKVLAFDSEKDVAVLYANLSGFPDALAQPQSLARERIRKLPSREKKYFRSAVPLGLKKITSPVE